MTHILLIHQSFASTQDAGGTRHFELARYLVQQGHRVSVITSQVSYLTGKQSHTSQQKKYLIEENTEGVEIWRIATSGRLHRNFISRLMNFFSFMVASIGLALRIRQVDLVMGTSPPIFQSISALIVARLKRVPFLFEVRDLWPDFAVDMGVLHNKFLIAASRWLETFLYRQAQLIVVNSPAYVTHVKNKGLPEENITFIPNGVDVDMFDPNTDGVQVRSDLGLEQNFIALYAGAHGQANDLRTLLQAAQHVQEQVDNITFVLVGDGKEKTNLVDYSQQLGLTNVRFVEAQPKAKMSEFLAAADVCVAILQNIPMFATTYPNKVFDYMAAERPTVLAIDGVIRDVVEKGQAGIFVPPGDAEALAQAVLELAANPTQCREMGRRGRRYVKQHFDRVQQAQQFEALVAKMQNHSPRKQPTL